MQAGIGRLWGFTVVSKSLDSRLRGNDERQASVMRVRDTLNALAIRWSGIKTGIKRTAAIKGSGRAIRVRDNF